MTTALLGLQPEGTICPSCRDYKLDSIDSRLSFKAIEPFALYRVSLSDTQRKLFPKLLAAARGSQRSLQATLKRWRVRAHCHAWRARTIVSKDVDHIIGSSLTAMSFHLALLLAVAGGEQGQRWLAASELFVVLSTRIHQQ